VSFSIHIESSSYPLEGIGEISCSFGYKVRKGRSIRLKHRPCHSGTVSDAPGVYLTLTVLCLISGSSLILKDPPIWCFVFRGPLRGRRVTLGTCFAMEWTAEVLWNKEESVHVMLCVNVACMIIIYNYESFYSQKKGVGRIVNSLK